MGWLTPRQDINQGFEDAKDWQQRAYQQGQHVLSPYTEPATTDMNAARQGLYDAYDQMAPYGVMSHHLWQTMGETPTALYQQDMAGYQLSPTAQAQLNQALLAANNAAAASGQLGGSNDQANAMRLAQTITAQDEQHYFNNIQQERHNQLSALSDYRRTQNLLASMFNQVLNREYGASSHLAQAGMTAANSLNHDALWQSQAHMQLDNDNLARIGNLLSMGLGLMWG